jgi:hypothetical protein
MGNFLNHSLPRLTAAEVKKTENVTKKNIHKRAPWKNSTISLEIKVLVLYKLLQKTQNEGKLSCFL